jgi:hypothetical protein
VVRSITYLGEEHPAAIKRVAVVPVAHLPLRDETAIHKAKLLAGTRWTSDPPKDAGVGFEEGSGKHGYIKVSCEDFPKPAMNLKWISDTFDRLIEEANVSFNMIYFAVTVFSSDFWFFYRKRRKRSKMSLSTPVISSRGSRKPRMESIESSVLGTGQQSMTSLKNGFLIFPPPLLLLLPRNIH